MAMGNPGGLRWLSGIERWAGTRVKLHKARGWHDGLTQGDDEGGGHTLDMFVGKGLKPEKATKAIDKSRTEIVEGEEIHAFVKCNNMRPMTDFIVITNARVMGLSTGAGFKFKARFDEIARTAYDPAAKTVRVETHDGSSMTFKQVASEDVPAVQHYVEQGRARPVPEHLAVALQELAERNGQGLSEEEQLQRFGRKTAEGAFGGKRVKIYENGYVRLSSPWAGADDKSTFQRLLAIEASSDVTKKTAIGRGVTAIATGGLNLLSPNKRGDVYLTITTDADTSVLHEDPPTAMNLAAVKKLEGAGRAVIQAPVPNSEAAEPVAPAERPLADRLRELQGLHDQGLITDQEHASQRSRLLGDL